MRDLTIDFSYRCTQLQRELEPETYTRLVHLRDLYMTGKIQKIAEQNPGKTILVIAGACHIFGIRDLLHAEIPERIMTILRDPEATLQELDSELQKYGGSLKQPINPERFSQLF